MRRVSSLVLFLLILSGFGIANGYQTLVLSNPHSSKVPAHISGFRNAADERKWETLFQAVPDPKMAEQDLTALASAPHMAGTPEDKQTAEYVARRFREAGLQTEIVEYKVWLNYPKQISVDVVAPPGVEMHGPTPERVNGDSFETDPRIVTAFSGYSPSADVQADVVYANYGRPEDFKVLQQMKIDVRGKIVIARYGKNFRGVKTFVAQQYGAAGLIIYSDPIDDGYFRGDVYPVGPWRPATGVQRGSVGYIFKFPGDATTPEIASLPNLPGASRTPPDKSVEMPGIPTTPLSYSDAQPILKNLGGPETPREWQGALPFTYHVGPGPVRVHLHLVQDYRYRSIWDVIGRIAGTQNPDEWVVAGNHRDAWVYGACDPNSGTTAMLQAVRGFGELLHAGWKPKRTMVLGSWDAEEFGLIGSTEWAEEHAAELAHAVAYVNVDVAVSGPNFGASATPALKSFIREVTKEVLSPRGGSVYDQWRKAGGTRSSPTETLRKEENPEQKQRIEPEADGVEVGDLGSGSDFTPFFDHLGVPSLDIGSTGPYGVYHSAFDNLDFFKKFADPTFVYEQEMARVFGLAVMRLADTDFLPYDYELYARHIVAYLQAAEKASTAKFGARSPNFEHAFEAVKGLQAKGIAVNRAEQDGNVEPSHVDAAIIAAERAFLLPAGLPNRPWYKHAIYAPGEYTGYAAVTLPGVTEAIEAGDLETLRTQVAELTKAITLAADRLQQH